MYRELRLIHESVVSKEHRQALARFNMAEQITFFTNRIFMACQKRKRPSVTKRKRELLVAIKGEPRGKR
ncbi:hypothetical protein [Massilia aquatica]|uniref:Uncharacterized protein n=1 Tax=Massilia aquatica TaxID=2609000 RepID=A0ABX0LXH4_9BURK|nr:hypothetical protein [Massilia aquatica]NHZ39536.1 hypothetical protein [Massilia aquatica]